MPPVPFKYKTPLSLRFMVAVSQWGVVLLQRSDIASCRPERPFVDGQETLVNRQTLPSTSTANV